MVVLQGDVLHEIAEGEWVVLVVPLVTLEIEEKADATREGGRVSQGAYRKLASDIVVQCSRGAVGCDPDTMDLVLADDRDDSLIHRLSPNLVVPSRVLDTKPGEHEEEHEDHSQEQDVLVIGHDAPLGSSPSLRS